MTPLPTLTRILQGVPVVQQLGRLRPVSQPVRTLARDRPIGIASLLHRNTTHAPEPAAPLRGKH